MLTALHAHIQPHMNGNQKIGTYKGTPRFSKINEETINPSSDYYFGKGKFQNIFLVGTYEKKLKLCHYILLPKVNHSLNASLVAFISPFPSTLS